MADDGPVLQRIAERGVVNACTNVENRPFAYLTPSGKAVGFNADLLENLRQSLSLRLGREISAQTIPTSGANRVPFVQQGKCDVIITGFSVTEERQRLVDFIFPGFYASGAVLLTRDDQVVDSWESLRGQTLCSSQGSTYNQSVAERYGVNILAFAGLTESAQALRDRRCIGQVMDEAVAGLRLQDSQQWQGYRIQLPVILEAPWSLAVAKGDPQWRGLLEQLALHWRQSGFLYELESRYGLPHKHPLDPTQVESTAVDTQSLPYFLQRLTDEFERLNTRTGWNFPVFYDGWTARQFASGILTTLQLSGIGIFGSCLIGLFGALAMGRQSRCAGWYAVTWNCCATRRAWPSCTSSISVSARCCVAAWRAVRRRGTPTRSAWPRCASPCITAHLRWKSYAPGCSPYPPAPAMPRSRWVMGVQPGCGISNCRWPCARVCRRWVTTWCS
ncbi:transporter substrate-binding domain-containing protein [Pseudomonas poae]|nr:transporter substrate-binding domain-containing protein [Pseudomonas poae]